MLRSAIIASYFRHRPQLSGELQPVLLVGIVIMALKINKSIEWGNYVKNLLDLPTVKLRQFSQCFCYASRAQNMKHFS